jgi:hypothetical protein
MQSIGSPVYPGRSHHGIVIGIGGLQKLLAIVGLHGLRIHAPDVVSVHHGIPVGDGGVQLLFAAVGTQISIVSPIVTTGDGGEHVADD